MTTETTETTAPAPAAAKPARKPAKKAEKKTAVKKSGAKLVKQADGDRVALKTLCSQLKIEPRAARRKLRAAELSFHDHRDRWNFTPKQAEKVKEVLRA